MPWNGLRDTTLPRSAARLSNYPLGMVHNVLFLGLLSIRAYCEHDFNKILFLIMMTLFGTEFDAYGA
jgi:hypothetical protein